ncbi:hypothetical protein GCM10009827_018900 [Dactylosporangium maewongense]|uniref:HEAT repeat domain-containing protein n=2 Tax=Dactylosporangium maewongense TaxID=634393 RepID=A0ABN1ZWP4_9ACTN
MADVADALRLLRQASAKTELESILNHLYVSGPLAALSRDGRQILAKRASQDTLSVLEMQVLKTAADLFAPSEARIGLDGVLNALKSGKAISAPGSSEIPVRQNEIAWIAVASLANVCQAHDEAALFLLSETVKHVEEDVDRTMSRALSQLEWELVSTKVQGRWLDFITNYSEQTRGIAEVMHARFGMSVPEPDASPGIHSLVYALNNVIHGGTVDDDLVENALPQIVDSLHDIRRRAASGAYTFGGVDYGDIAVALIVNCTADQLWQPLADFLLDFRVLQEDRKGAFERLARSNLVVPDEIAARFRENAVRLVSAPGPSMSDEPTLPFPPAVRFLGAYRLIDEAELYFALAGLAGSSNVKSRREAAVTLATLARHSSHEYLLPLALPLTGDSDSDVRANAARSLTLLSRSGGVLATVAMKRLEEVLDDDGVLTPVLALKALKDQPLILPPAFRAKLVSLGRDHPSRLVRQEAIKLTSRAEGTSEILPSSGDA